MCGKVIGFEIDKEESINKEEGNVATSLRKIGTMTFIKKETSEFAALGHSSIGEKSTFKTLTKGKCYDVELEELKKGTEKEVGGIIAYLDTKSPIGYIYYDSNHGIFGEVNGIEKEYKETETMCWYEASKGKANILTSLDGRQIKSYEVEIIDINYIHKNRNIKIKVTDEELIEKTGGIIQGMSGTPLMQNR